MCCSRNNLHGRLGIAHIKKWFDSAQPAGSSRAFYNMFPGRLVLSVADRSAPPGNVVHNDRGRSKQCSTILSKCVSVQVLSMHEYYC